jgi:hypothetical protein
MVLEYRVGCWLTAFCRFKVCYKFCTAENFDDRRHEIEKTQSLQFEI